MKKQNKLTYETPTLTVVEFRTERGFAESTLAISAQQAIDGFINAEMAMKMGETGAYGDVLASTMTGGNEDYSANGGAGTGWQYDNGSWF